MFDLAPRLRHSRQNRQTFFNTRVDLPCPVCGTAVVFEPRASGVICAHCRSPLHRQPDEPTPLAPTGVLLFRLTDEEARQAIAAEEGRADWQAKGLPPPPVVRRLYVPYWQFAAHVVASWRVREYDRVHEQYDTKSGGFASDYDDALLAATVDDDMAALAALRPEGLAEAVGFEPARLGEISALLPTVALDDAWSSMRERWEKRLSTATDREARGGLFDSREIDDMSSEYSQERGALVYVPVFVPEPGRHGAATPLVVDGYSGAVVRARRRRHKSGTSRDVEQIPQVPEAVIGVAVLAVIGIFVALLALWLVRRLWWY